VITDPVDYVSGSVGIGHDTLKRFLDFDLSLGDADLNNSGRRGRCCVNPVALPPGRARLAT